MKYLYGILVAVIFAVIATKLTQHLRKTEDDLRLAKVEATEDGTEPFEITPDAILSDFERTREAIEQELESAKAAIDKLARAKQDAESELAAAQHYHERGQDTLQAFRDAFQDAEQGYAYPVEVQGRPLHRDDLLLRAELTLLMSENTAKFLPMYKNVLDSISQLEGQLDDQVQTARMLTSYLAHDLTRRELEANSSKLRLLAHQVETFTVDNRQILSQIDQPVPTLDDMIQTMEFEPSDDDTDQRVLDFLKRRKPGGSALELSGGD
ncbi:MAG: hypothetical protein GY711_27800 [bacterium]|nr:hypothetical protein [bacterium]